MALVHILDRQTDRIIGTISISNKEYWEALRKDNLENNESFDFTANASVDKASLLEKRNRLIVQDEDGFFREFIITYTEQVDRGKKDVRSDASYGDLIKAKVIEPQVLQGATSATATDEALLGTEWQAGVIEYNGIHTITIENYTDPLTMLKLIAATFDLEISYRIVVRGGKVVGRYVDMKKKVTRFKGKETVFAKDLIGVRRKEDSDLIVTALLGIGPQQEDGSYLTALVESPEALKRWGRNGQHLIEPYEPDSSDDDMTVERLQELTLNELNKRIDAIVSYECEAISLEHIEGLSHEKIRKGETIRIKDEGYNPPLYVEGRITEVEVDPATNRIERFEIGSFIEYKKEDLEEQIAGLKRIINDKIAKLVLSTITSSSGTVFKNGEGSTMLTAKVFLSGQEVDLDGTRYSYQWIKYDKDGVIDIGFNKTTKSITVDHTEITEKATYSVEISTDKVISTSQITITALSDGQSLYTWVKYASDINGTGLSDDPTDKGFIGFSYNKDTAIESENPADYTWNAVEGSQGVPGTSYYTWLKYATTPTTGMSDNPTGKLYMGLAHNKTTATESTNYADYTWSLIKGEQGPQGPPGDQGIPGPPGDNGESLFTWIKYADDSSGNGMSDSPTNKKYIGLAYNKTSQTESNVPTDYAWSLIEGPAGVPGTTFYTWIKYADDANGTNMSDSPTGKKYMGIAYNKTSSTESTTATDYSWSLIQGPQGVPGPPGSSLFTWIKYADTPTTGMSDTPTGKKYIGLAYNKTSSTESAVYTDYSWSLIEGPEGPTGPKGPNGETLYTWIKYATTPTTGMSDSPTGKKYLGIAYNKTSATESTVYSDYSWSLIEGPQGPQGPQGIPGPTGSSLFTWVKYADNASGGGMSDSPTGKTYIGLAYNKTSSNESALAADYSWSLFKGDQGVQGPPGDDGVTTYTWIKYADDDQGNGMSDDPAGKRYLGIAYNKTTATESVTKTDYAWSPLYDNVEVGGVNMLPHTDFAVDDMSYWRAYNSNSQAGDKTEITLDGGEVITFMRVRSINGLAQSSTFGVTSGANTISEEKMSFIAGEKYTISFLVAVHANATQNLSYTYLLNDGGTNQSLSMPYVATQKLYGHMTTPFSLNVYEYSFTFVARDTWDRTRLLLGARTSADFTGTNSFGLFYVSRPQIEKGNVRSEWKPKPSDTLTYTWVMYADDKDGSNITSNPAGKFWRGRSFNRSTPTPSTDPGDYTWEFITDGWVKTGTVKMDGGNIYADSLSVISANLGKMTAGEMEGVSLKLGLGGNGDLQVWGDIDGDGVFEIIGRVDNTGGYYPKLHADEIVGDVTNKYMGQTKTVYFDTSTGDDANDGTVWSKAKKNIKTYVESLPKNLNGKTITLYFRGNITGGFDLEGFHGGNLYVSGDTSTTRYKVYGYAKAKNCYGGRFLLQGFDVVYDATSTPAFTLCKAEDCDYIFFYSVKAYGNGGGKHGFWFERSNGQLSECHVYNITDRGLYAAESSRVYMVNNRGVGVAAILADSGSSITGTGTRWSGSITRWNNANVGAVNSAGTGWTVDVWTIDTAEGTPTQPAPPAKQTLVVSAATGDNYSSQGFWTNDEIKQGDYGYGDRYGLWYFDLAAIKGKTVTSASLTFYRNPGVGASAARTAYIRSHGYPSRSSRPASLSSASYSASNGVNASASAGQTVTVDVTNLVNLNIAKGSHHSLGVYNTESTDYMSLGLTPTLHITFS
jgi:phage minor structural protein